RAGMKLVAFDRLRPDEAVAVHREPIQGIPLREAAMARTIDEEILRRDPHARVLVWVGMGHACKLPLDVNGTPRAMMARCLWQRTGIEPFCIYQLSDSGDPDMDEGLYRLVVKEAGRPIRDPVGARLPVDGYRRPIPAALRGHPVYGGM